jgi:small subunit ribosomal protein S21
MKIINVEMYVKKNESIDRTIKRFSKKVKKERIVEGVRERKYYEKPSEKKRKIAKRRKNLIEKMKREQSKD